MADETQQAEEPKPAEEAKPEEPSTPKHNWEYRTDFKINERMREVVKLTISASEAELTMLRRKLEKLYYGS